MASRGFWSRVLQDYDCRQVIFEVKNYADLTADDFRQVLSYTTPEYGRFAVLVTRTDREALTELEKGWVKELWTGHQRLVLVLPAPLLARCLRKMRVPKKKDYAEDVIGKRLDTFVRAYLSLRAGRSYRKRK
jgi:hypothetical protein